MGLVVGSYAHCVQNQGCDLKSNKCRVSKTMLNNSRTKEESAERYMQELPNLIERVRNANVKSARETYKDASNTITRPWVDMI